MYLWYFVWCLKYYIFWISVFTIIMVKVFSTRRVWIRLCMLQKYSFKIPSFGNLFSWLWSPLTMQTETCFIILGFSKIVGRIKVHNFLLKKGAYYDLCHKSKVTLWCFIIIQKFALLGGSVFLFICKVLL